MGKKKKGRLTLNVHGYESQIRETYQKCLSEDNKSYEPFDDVAVKIKDLITSDSKSSNETKDRALKSLHLIVKDKGNKKNNDKTNLIELEDLLPRIWAIISQYDTSAQTLFVEQLADMAKGSCSQGRNIRLVQFYIVSRP
jgi:hypothetical protein